MSVLSAAGRSEVSVVGARLMNVSSYGMMIESPVSLERDAVMRFRLVVAGEKSDVEARVAACTPVPGSHRYAVGLEFLGMAPGVQERLVRVLAGRDPAA